MDGCAGTRSFGRPPYPDRPSSPKNGTRFHSGRTAVSARGPQPGRWRCHLRWEVRNLRPCEADVGC
eukprot:1082115-Prymnesium_polylepis.1